MLQAIRGISRGGGPLQQRPLPQPSGRATAGKEAPPWQPGLLCHRGWDGAATRQQECSDDSAGLTAGKRTLRLLQALDAAGGPTANKGSNAFSDMAEPAAGEGRVGQGGANSNSNGRQDQAAVLDAAAAAKAPPAGRHTAATSRRRGAMPLRGVVVQAMRARHASQHRSPVRLGRKARAAGLDSPPSAAPSSAGPSSLPTEAVPEVQLLKRQRLASVVVDAAGAAADQRDSSQGEMQDPAERLLSQLEAAAATVLALPALSAAFAQAADGQQRRGGGCVIGAPASPLQDAIDGALRRLRPPEASRDEDVPSTTAPLACLQQAPHHQAARPEADLTPGQVPGQNACSQCEGVATTDVGVQHHSAPCARDVAVETSQQQVGSSEPASAGGAASGQSAQQQQARIPNGQLTAAVAPSEPSAMGFFAIATAAAAAAATAAATAAGQRHQGHGRKGANSTRQSPHPSEAASESRLEQELARFAQSSGGGSGDHSGCNEELSRLILSTFERCGGTIEPGEPLASSGAGRAAADCSTHAACETTRSDAALPAGAVGNSSTARQQAPRFLAVTEIDAVPAWGQHQQVLGPGLRSSDGYSRGVSSGCCFAACPHHMRVPAQQEAGGGWPHAFAGDEGLAGWGGGIRPSPLRAAGGCGAPAGLTAAQHGAGWCTSEQLFGMRHTQPVTHPARPEGSCKGESPTSAAPLVARRPQSPVPSGSCGQQDSGGGLCGQPPPSVTKGGREAEAAEAAAIEMDRALASAAAAREAARAAVGRRVERRGAALRGELAQLARMLGEADALAAEMQSDAAEAQRQVEEMLAAEGGDGRRAGYAST